MNHTLFRGAAIACFASSMSAVSVAQECCGDAINCVITRPRPVVSVQLRAQPVTTYCDVTETQMTHRKVVENVPVTTCKNVTVDEGGYQMVWVPKPVTRQVSQTVMQQQVKTVAVPIQVTRKVPHISTQMVPVQTTHFVNETVPVHRMAMSTGCDTCGGMQSVVGQSLFAPPAYPTTNYQPPPYPSTPIPTMPAITVPLNPSTPRPNPRMDVGIPVPGTQDTSEETVRPRGGVPTPNDEANQSTRKTSMFQGVPSAASVWKRQDSYAR